MPRPLQKIAEWRNVGLATFRDDIAPQNRPAILRGLAADWPAVREGLKSPAALAGYIRRFDHGMSAPTIVGAASIKGRFFYDGEDLLNLNFASRQKPVAATLDWLIEHQADQDPPAVAIQSLSLPEHLPGFADDNHTNLAPASATAMIWLSNATTVATHFDMSYNIACVVAGHRRFTLFPPEQLPNLYLGPLHKTPAGAPVSMVSLEEPDLVRYPRFEQAMEAAMTAELEPGDAIYIPYFWFHHVEALDGFNALVSHWWNQDAAPASSPLHCLLFGILTLRSLPPDQRAAWRATFDHYVFGTTGIDAAAHLDARHQGVLGPLTPGLVETLREILLASLRAGPGSEPAG